jgi:hypothetical protein
VWGGGRGAGGVCVCVYVSRGVEGCVRVCMYVYARQGAEWCWLLHRRRHPARLTRRALTLPHSAPPVHVHQEVGLVLLVGALDGADE